MKKKIEEVNNLEDFMESLEEKTPREVNKELKASIPNNMLLMTKVLPDIKAKNEGLKKTFPEINKLCQELRLFFEELERDDIIKIETSLFNTTTKEAQKEGDERGSGLESFKKTKQEKLSYSETFRELNNFYHGAYCFVTKNTLKKIAEKLAGREVRIEGDVVQELKKYRDGKYKGLFEVLKPQIKNSISHKTFYIDRKLPIITYEDEKKPHLKLSLQEFSKLCDGIFFFQLALDALNWDFFMEFYTNIANKLIVVNRFLEKYDGKVTPTKDKSKAFSLYDLGKFLEENKDKWPEVDK